MIHAYKSVPKAQSEPGAVATVQALNFDWRSPSKCKQLQAVAKKGERQRVECMAGRYSFRY